MSTTVKQPVVQASTQEQRSALIDQLCATRGTQYQGLKKYRSHNRAAK